MSNRNLKQNLNRETLLPVLLVLLLLVLLAVEWVDADLQSIYVWDYDNEELEKDVILSDQTAEIDLENERSEVEEINLYMTSESETITGNLMIEVVTGGEVLAQWQVDVSEYVDSDETFVITLEPEESLTGAEDDGLELLLDASGIEGSLSLSGYTMLYGSIGRRTIYLFVAASSLLLMGAALMAATRLGRGLQEEQRFILLAIPAGLLFIAVLPYTQCPDDMYHFMRIWDVLEGNILSTKVGDSVGGYLPANLTAGLDWGSGYREIYRAMEQTIDPDTTKWYYFANTALYSPVAYLPQILGVGLARLFTNHVLILVSAGRIAGYLFSVLMTYCAIRLLPFGKQLIVIIAMTPMFLQEASALGTDGFVNSVTLLFVACILHFIYCGAMIRRPQRILLTVLSFSVAMCKVVYLPFCLLLLLLPKEKMTWGNDRSGRTAGIDNADVKDAAAWKRVSGGRNAADTRSGVRRLIFCWGNIVFGTLCNLGWTALVSGYIDYFAKGGVDSKAQTILVLTHPVQYILVMYRTFMASAVDYVFAMFGAGLGYISNISVGNVIPFLLIAAFVWICWADKGNAQQQHYRNKRHGGEGSAADRGRLSESSDFGQPAIGEAGLRKQDLFAFAALIVVIVVLTFTSLYVQFTDYGESVIEGLQGRYFIPLLLPAGLLMREAASRRNRRIRCEVSPEAEELSAAMRNANPAEGTSAGKGEMSDRGAWWIYPLLGYTTAFALVQIMSCL